MAYSLPPLPSKKKTSQSFTLKNGKISSKYGAAAETIGKRIKLK